MHTGVLYDDRLYIGSRFAGDRNRINPIQYNIMYGSGTTERQKTTIILHTNARATRRNISLTLSLSLWK